MIRGDIEGYIIIVMTKVIPAFDLQNNMYWTQHYKTEQHNIRQNNTRQILAFCFIRILGDEILFWYFRQLVRGTKSCVVVW